MSDIFSCLEQEIEKALKIGKLSLNTLIYFDENSLHFENCANSQKITQTLTASELTLKDELLKLKACITCFPSKFNVKKHTSNDLHAREGMRRVLFFLKLQAACKTNDLFLLSNVRKVFSENNQLFNSLTPGQCRVILEKTLNEISSQKDNLFEFNKLTSAIQVLWEEKFLKENFTSNYFSNLSLRESDHHAYYAILATCYQTNTVPDAKKIIMKLIQEDSRPEKITLKDVFDTNPEVFKICSSYEEILAYFHEKKEKILDKALKDFDADLKAKIDSFNHGSHKSYLNRTSVSYESDKGYSKLKAWLTSPLPNPAGRYGYNENMQRQLCFAIEPYKTYGNYEYRTSFIDLTRAAYNFNNADMILVPNGLTESELETTATLLNDRSLTLEEILEVVKSI